MNYVAACIGGYFLAGIAYWGIVCIYEKHLKELSISVKKIAEGDEAFGSIGEDGQEAAIRYSILSIERQLKHNAQELEKDKLFQKNFLADISHQLKMPLSSLCMYNDILLEYPNESLEDRLHFLKQCKKQIDHIDWLVYVLLRSARIESGTERMNFENSKLLDTVENALSCFDEDTMEIKVNFIVDISEETYLLHDSNWVAEAIRNIVKNAMDHSQADGSIYIISFETPLTVELIIRDEGDGIDAGKVPHIFERFYGQEHGAASENTGIGLSLAKNIIEQNNGEIHVKSQIGYGSSFIITFLKIS